MHQTTTKEEVAATVATHVGFLLRHQCGLPDTPQRETVAARAEQIIYDIVKAGALTPEELRFLVNTAFDIQPVSDLSQAAREAGFASSRIAEITRVHREIVGEPAHA